MTDLNRTTALRIALAAKQVPEVGVARLLEFLNRHAHAGMDEEGLRGITVAQMSAEFAGLPGLSRLAIKDAVRILWGEAEAGQVPEVEACFADRTGVIRVAVASNQGEMLDGHFGSCLRFLIYELNVLQVRLVEVRTTLESDLADDKNTFRAHLLRDCQVLYVSSIGGPAAAKVIRVGVHPVKVKQIQAARDVMEQLRQVMQVSPPPWLAKHMGQHAIDRVRFDRSSVED